MIAGMQKLSSEHLIDEVLAARWHLLLDARLMEIDENLVRADLSPAERAAHHEERKRAWEREHPETRKRKRSRRSWPGK